MLKKKTVVNCVYEADKHVAKGSNIEIEFMKSKIEKVFVGGRYIPAPQDYYDAPIIRKDISLEQLEKEIKEEEEKSKHRND